MQMTRLAVVLVAVALSGCMSVHRASAPESLRAAHQPGTGVLVESENGAIEIAVDPSAADVAIDAVKTAGGSDDAQARARLAQVRVLATRDDAGRLFVRAEYPGGRQNGDGCAFTIRLPDVGSVEVNTGNGDVRLVNCGGDARIDTSNGNVSVTGQRGAVAVTTSNGTIVVDGASGPCELHTSNGGIQLAGVASRVDAHSSNGAISLAPLPNYRESFRLDTSNGGIHVRLSGDSAGLLHAVTSSGRVDARSVRGALAMSGSSDDRMVTIGAGGAECHARTSNGNIEVSVE